jgi:hypothetical protein
MDDAMPATPISRARSLAGLIAAEADAIEKARLFSPRVLEALHEARLFRMLYPHSVGGDEVEPRPIRARGRRTGAGRRLGRLVRLDRQQHRTYEAAGVDAIFPGSPFERRFRDIHTVSQQIQSRDAHYESVGQVLLGNPPEMFF